MQRTEYINSDQRSKHRAKNTQTLTPTSTLDVSAHEPSSACRGAQGENACSSVGGRVTSYSIAVGQGHRCSAAPLPSLCLAKLAGLEITST